MEFDTPFEHICLGVVLTQSNGDYGSRANIAANNLTASGFNYYAGDIEISRPIYYMAFGY